MAITCRQLIIVAVALGDGDTTDRHRTLVEKQTGFQLLMRVTVVVASFVTELGLLSKTE